MKGKRPRTSSGPRASHSSQRPKSSFRGQTARRPSPNKPSPRSSAISESANPTSFDARGLRWAIGLHSSREALNVRPRAVRHLYLRTGWEDSQQLRELADLGHSAKIRIETRSPGQLDQIGFGHQGVALGISESPQINWAELEQPGPHLILILDGLEDPHNLGSILRTAWLCGAKGVLIPADRAVGLTPAVVKVASGGAEHVPVETVANFAPSIELLKKAGFWIFGLSEAAKRKPWEFEFPDKVAWVVGSESHGMRVTTERLCDEIVRIPQVSSGSSFNASIALAMALTETIRQWGKPE